MKPKHLLVIGSLLSVFQLMSQDHEAKYFRGKAEDSLEVMNKLSMARGVYNIQDYDSVISISETILTRSLDIDFVRGVGESYFLKARALNRMGSRNKAIEMYRKALGYFESLNDHQRMACAYNNLGLILKAMGKFREAIEAGENALEYASGEPHSKLFFNILINVGVVCPEPTGVLFTLMIKTPFHC